MYTIRTGVRVEPGSLKVINVDSTQDLEVRRRYSEFSSLRATLVNLHPTLIIPPIPEKHSMADYAAKPTKAKEDMGIIDLRKRMLSVFLNRCRKMKEVREDGVWWRFLDPNASWVRRRHSEHPAHFMDHVKKVLIQNSGRSITFTPSCIDSKEQYESPSARPLQSDTSPQLAPSTFIICEAEISVKHLLKRHTILSSRVFNHGFVCSTYNTRSPGVRAIPTNISESIRTRP